jgi:hypothetical protein
MREPARRPASCPLRTQQRAWSALSHLRPSPPRTSLRAAVLIRGRRTRLPSQRSTHEHPVDGLTSNYCRRPGCGRGTRPFGRRPRQLLLRKEVIQPHLPVRLPCYDFVPIADPTFDGSLPQGVRPPASGVTDFRDVTGGVYKARERIHRSVADLRLLATPTSWGRVADPNPN